MMDEPTLRTEVERMIHDHEVFLSFVNDSDAELFHEWWNATGWESFRDWAGKELHRRLKEYDE